jgi:hypothetical protein
MKETVKRMLQPVRRLAARFVNVEPVTSEDGIMRKAASLIAAENVEGDYLEFGVFRGSSLISSYDLIKQAYEQDLAANEWRTEQDRERTRRTWDGMRFFAFDSFQGLPQPSGGDRDTNDFAMGQYSCTEDKVRENLAKAGVPLDKVVTIAGWFDATCTDETIRANAMKKASIVHVNCNFYSSSMTALRFVGPLLTDGTVIVFDDWYCYRGNPGLGEQKAFNEWKTTMPEWVFSEYQKEGPWKTSFIASRRDVV